MQKTDEIQRKEQYRKRYLLELNKMIDTLNNIQTLRKKEREIKRKTEELAVLFGGDGNAKPESKEETLTRQKISKTLEKLLQENKEIMNFLGINKRKNAASVESRLKVFLNNVITRDSENEKKITFASLFNKGEREIIKSHFKLHNSDSANDTNAEDEVLETINIDDFISTPSALNEPQQTKTKKDSRFEELEKLFNLNKKVGAMVEKISGIVEECELLLEEMDELINQKKQEEKVEVNFLPPAKEKGGERKDMGKDDNSNFKKSPKVKI